MGWRCRVRSGIFRRVDGRRATGLQQQDQRERGGQAVLHEELHQDCSVPRPNDLGPPCVSLAQETVPRVTEHNAPVTLLRLQRPHRYRLLSRAARFGGAALLEGLPSHPGVPTQTDKVKWLL